MHFTPVGLVMFALAAVMLGVTIFTKPRINPLFRVDPAAARASGIVFWGFFAAWPIAMALEWSLDFKQAAYFVFAICFAILLWGRFHARSV